MTQSKERVMGEEGLYRSSFEHDNCGIGAVVNIKGEKSHATVENALKIVENLEHRAGKDAEGKTGDGVGLCQIGAAVMGEQGYKYEEILSHYYPGSTLEKQYQ